MHPGWSPAFTFRRYTERLLRTAETSTGPYDIGVYRRQTVVMSSSPGADWRFHRVLRLPMATGPTRRLIPVPRPRIILSKDRLLRDRPASWPSNGFRSRASEIQRLSQVRIRRDPVRFHTRQLAGTSVRMR